MANLLPSFSKACELMKFDDLNKLQKEAITELLLRKSDLFISLPIGFGKSVIFQALPAVVDDYSGKSGHIVVVISPLLSLIQDQCERLRQLGISCINLSDLSTEEEKNLVELGSHSVVYATPESLLKNERWRRMLSSTLYRQKVCAIAIDEAHVIKQWGISNSVKMAPFRECYGRLHELRSLIPNVPIMALTATATKDTKQSIINVLNMKKPYVIEESPEKANVTYVVAYMDRYQNTQDNFEWLAEEIKKDGVSVERTIIYCQTIQQCSHIYLTLKAMIGDAIYALEPGDKTSVVLEMLHSCSPPANKKAVLKSFQNPKGVIRILVATIAFGMGIDCKGVHRTIHFGPSKNIESFVQESGRAGRDGKPSISYLLYHGLLLTHVEKDIKDFIHSKECRRKCLLQEFDKTTTNDIVAHLCCDNCAKHCNCKSLDCCLLTYPTKKIDLEYENTRERVVTESQKKELQEKLIIYHKTLVAELVSKHANGIVHSHTSLPMLIGFSELQITQVLKHCNHIFSLKDVHHFVEIWDIKHASTIIALIDDVFGDISSFTADDLSQCCEEADIDDELQFALENWNNIVDEDFMDLVFDNYFDSSHFNSELNEESETSSCTSDIPCTVMEVLQNLSFEVV